MALMILILKKRIMSQLKKYKIFQLNKKWMTIQSSIFYLITFSFI